jgi:hypothetical protein
LVTLNKFKMSLALSYSATATAGTTIHYQVYYRDAAPYCLPGTMNLTNAYSIHWQP